MIKTLTNTTEKSLEIIDIVALILLFVGGVTWGLMGIFNWNLVSAIFSAVPFLARLIYVLVGVSAIYMAIVTPMILRYRQEHPNQGTAPPTGLL
jgi:uncharacterized membrane protein YuzA (DUF378 family)